jgi:L-asparaginase|tara:strand:+ start:1185 stop:2204 length:1020 start_codon:yes stop_codon:yes gene_type:complete
MKKSKVLLLYTGGTIGMIENPVESSLKPFNFDQITMEVPELNKLNCTIETIAFENPLDSSNMNFESWTQIGDEIFKNYDYFDGFVVLHGTDTMSYTASALSLMFQNLIKPIILTGSQLPLGQVRTDGKENLITAVEIASMKRNNLSIVKEVAIYFENQLFRGNRTTKVSSDHFDAFKSYNYPSLADIGVEINFNLNYLLKNKIKKIKYEKGFEPSINIVFFYPGIIIKNVVKSIRSNSSKVVVLMSYGSGNLPIENELEEFLNSSKKIFLNVSQCKAGKIEQGKYETGMQLKKAGVIGVRDMTLETVIVKSMMLIKKYPLDKDKFTKVLLTNIAGEISE